MTVLDQIKNMDTRGEKTEGVSWINKPWALISDMELERIKEGKPKKGYTRLR